MDNSDALSGAKFDGSGGLFVSDFPVKIRVLTLDPLVHVDKFANTRYAFVVLNLDSNKVQIIDKGSSFAQAFQSIHTDEDFGSDIRRVDVKIKTNGKSGQDTRYEFNVLGSPSDLTPEQLVVIKDANVDLDAVIKKNSPNALRLSEINQGKKIRTEEVADVVIEDVGDEPINLDDIPF